MSLTGRPLLALTALLTLAVAATTVLLWRRRWLAVRVTGLLLAEVLVVATVGLEFNRREEFYPSWQALTGDTGTSTRTASAAPQLLDADSGKDVAWQPPTAAAWHLAAPPRLVVPDDYAARPGARFPVIVALVPSARPALAAAHHVRDVVTLVLVPTRATTAAQLSDLPTVLAADARVTPSGWDLVAPEPTAGLAAAFARTQPPGFATASGWQADQLAAPLNAAEQLPAATG